MLRIILILLLMTTPVWSAQWRAGTGENTLLGTSNASDIDTNAYNSIVNPLDNLLSNYKQGFKLTYNSASQINSTAGSITVSNSDGSIRLMLRNANDTTVSFSDLDTGVEASSTTYYVYAIAASSSSTAATFKISANSTSPSGFTYYKRLGSFLNDGSSNITTIDNDDILNENNTWTAKTGNVIYQALTDGYLVALYNETSGSTSADIVTDNVTPPTVVRSITAKISGSAIIPGFTPVRAGDYYEVKGTPEIIYFLSKT